MATGINERGNAYYRCEKCGAYQEGIQNSNGAQDVALARTALRTHMLLKHNTPE